MTTTMAMAQRDGAPNAEENLPLSSFSSLFSRSSSLFLSLAPFPRYLFLFSLVFLGVPCTSLLGPIVLSLSLSPFPPSVFPIFSSSEHYSIARPEPAKIVSAVLDFAHGSFQRCLTTAPRPSSDQVHRPGSIQVALPSR